MPSDARAAQARKLHRGSLTDLEHAAQKREARDALVRALRREDPKFWTYPRLAREIGCSAELIALIMRKTETEQRQEQA